MGMIDDLFENVTKDDIDRLLKMGEGVQVEFKRTVPTLLDLARYSSAFANTRGGVLLVGVEEPRRVVGCNTAHVGQLVNLLHQRVRPLPSLRMHVVDYGGKQVAAVVVKPLVDAISVSDAGAYVRVGEAIRTIQAGEIVQRPPEVQPVNNQHLAEAIADLSRLLEKIRGELAHAQSLCGQWRVLLAGFGLGILASVIASFIYAAVTA